MDAKKFGCFIAAKRKEKHMTQTELGRRLHVTDKAVSKWERGLGFPDINTVIPLAEALGVSVVELMYAEQTEEPTISDSDASELMERIVALQKRNQEQEQTAAGLAAFTTVFTAILFYLAGFGNIGGSLLFGAIAAVAQSCVYFYLTNRNDREGRNIYVIIGAAASFVMAWLLYIVVC